MGNKLCCDSSSNNKYEINIIYPDILSIQSDIERNLRLSCSTKLSYSGGDDIFLQEKNSVIQYDTLSTEMTRSESFLDPQAIKITEILEPEFYLTDKMLEIRTLSLKLCSEEDTLDSDFDPSETGYLVSLEGLYIGEIENNYPHGFGRLFQYNSYYVGYWENGKKQGRGRYIKIGCGQDYKIYDGDWKQGQMTGYGALLWSDGRYYIGNVKNGKRHGFGEFQWADGKIYKGYWKKGYQYGEGSLTLPNGKSMTRMWRMDNPVRWIDFETEEAEAEIICEEKNRDFRLPLKSLKRN